LHEEAATIRSCPGSRDSVPAGWASSPRGTRNAMRKAVKSYVPFNRYLTPGGPVSSAVLGHELWHARDYGRPLVREGWKWLELPPRFQTTDPEPRALWNNEVRAVRLENQLFKEMYGKPGKRMVYSGFKVPDATASLVGPCDDKKCKEMHDKLPWGK